MVVFYLMKTMLRMKRKCNNERKKVFVNLRFFDLFFSEVESIETLTYFQITSKYVLMRYKGGFSIFLYQIREGTSRK